MFDKAARIAQRDNAIAKIMSSSYDELVEACYFFDVSLGTDTEEGRNFMRRGLISAL